VNDFLRRAAALYPDKTAVVDGERRYTYRDFQARVNRLSNALCGLGVGRGDRVCILSPNSHFFLESFYGTSQIGAVLVPLNYRLAAADHEYILNHAGVKAVLVDWEYAGIVDEIRKNLATVEHWIAARDDDPAAHPEEALPREARSAISGPSRRARGWTDWEDLIAGAGPEAPPAVALDENDLVSINYTSGTTARPKGVMLTHRNCYLNAYNLIAHLGVRHEDVELWTLPMFHCNGWGGVYALTGVGGTHVVLRAIDARAIFDLIEREGVTFACMAPAVLRTILDYPDRARHDVRTRPRFAIAGAPPPAAFIERLEKDLGWEFIQLYGLTETAPLLTIARPDHYTRREDWARRARAGVAGIGVEIEVRDEQGRAVPQDGQAVGEVCARSNVVFKGYWRQPDETARAIRDGWFHTGDLAVWDAVGNVHIVDRKKDVIISGGENISSADIEDTLYQHPAVLECAVIGVPDEKWGETPKALIVARPDRQPTAEEIIAFCRERLAHFKCPTSVDFVEALPRTATGKLQKFVLRERYWGGAQRRVN
jgi:fatty-acyl-CoA synthase